MEHWRVTTAWVITSRQVNGLAWRDPGLSTHSIARVTNAWYASLPTTTNYHPSTKILLKKQKVLDNSGNKSSGDRTLLSTVDADADDLWWIWVVWQWRLVKLLRPVAATIIGSGEPRFDGVFVDVSALCSHLVNRKWLASMSECCGPLLLMMMDTPKAATRS